MNARLRLLTVLCVAALASACGKNDGADSPAVSDSAASPDSQAVSDPGSDSDSGTGPTISITPFNIDDIPVSDKDIGEFPFFAPPKGYSYVTPALTTYEERISLREPFHHYYPIGVDRLYTVKGKVLRVALYNEKMKAPTERDARRVLGHYEDAIIKAGGVMVFEEKIEFNKIKNIPFPEGHSGKITTPRGARKAYVIHGKEFEAWFDVDCSDGYHCLYTVTQKGKM